MISGRFGNLGMGCKFSECCSYRFDYLDVKLYPSPETKEALIAEARCMRAWAYANLFWMFGHWWEADDCAYGILYRDQMSNLSNLQVPRSLSENLIRKFLKIWNRG